MIYKYISKLHRGFNKQVSRQNKKESIIEIQIMPVILSYDEDENDYRPLTRKFFNNKWNGMNLKNIQNSFSQTQPDWLHSKVKSIFRLFKLLNQLYTILLSICLKDSL